MLYSNILWNHIDRDIWKPEAPWCSTSQWQEILRRGLGASSEAGAIGRAVVAAWSPPGPPGSRLHTPAATKGQGRVSNQGCAPFRRETWQGTEVKMRSMCLLASQTERAPDTMQTICQPLSLPEDRGQTRPVVMWPSEPRKDNRGRKKGVETGQKRWDSTRMPAESETPARSPGRETPRCAITQSRQC